MRFRLQIPQRIHESLIDHARADAPAECVGLLAGSADGQVVERYPLVNALASSRRFESEPRSLLAAERARRQHGLELLAVYHSHPSSPAIPSRVDTDPDVNFWLGTDIVCVIVSLMGAEADVLAYWLTPGSYEAAEIAIIP